MSQDSCPVDLTEVTIAKVDDGHFLITAKGTTSDGGWTASLSPYVYAKEPDVWEIAAGASCAHGRMHNHMVSQWHASITMALGAATAKITVVGRNSITENVPH